MRLMATLVFLPVVDESQVWHLPALRRACGTGGMLTVAEETLGQLAAERGKDVSTHLFGQEINAETYAICTADLLLKGEGEAADNIVGGPEHSTLANDAFTSREFDFMLSNPSPRGLGGDTRRAGRQRSRGGPLGGEGALWKVYPSRPGGDAAREHSLAPAEGSTGPSPAEPGRSCP